MKKFIGTMLICGIAASTAASCVYADAPLLSAKNADKYTISVDGANVDLGKSAAYKSGAKWTKDGLTFSVFADTVISEKDVETIISSIK